MNCCFANHKSQISNSCLQRGVAALSLVDEGSVGVASSFGYFDGGVAIAGYFARVVGVRGDDEVDAGIACKF